jgi:hypothetical protein
MKLQSFQGMLVTGVRFIFNKFPPSNMQALCKAPPSTMEFFSTSEGDLNTLGRLWTDDERLWLVLALSQLAGKKKGGQMIYTVNDNKIWIALQVL